MTPDITQEDSVSSSPLVVLAVASAACYVVLVVSARLLKTHLHSHVDTKVSSYVVSFLALSDMSPDLPRLDCRVSNF